MKILLALLTAITAVLLAGSVSASPRTSYRVIHVSPDDPVGLNVRDNVIEATSLANTTIVGSLAWNASGIVSSGKEVDISGSVWREIRQGNTIGWVNEKYLEEEINNGQPEIKPELLNCGGSEPFWGLNLSGFPSYYTGETTFTGKWEDKLELKNVASNPITEMGDEHWLMTLKRPAKEHYIHIVIAKASPMCTDSMTNLRYPYESILMMGKVPTPLYGCCSIDLAR